MALPKWTDERTQSLTDFVGSESPISQATVAAAAEHLETSTRSVSSKLRKMGFDVELASSVSHRTFSDEQEANSRDPILTQIPQNRRPSLLAQQKESPEGKFYEFDIYMQGNQETVFFHL